MPNCPKCDQPLKLIPAGTSKGTGKEYNAFWACSDRNCGFTKKVEGEGTTPVNAMTKLAKVTEEKKWEEISTGKVRHGFAIEAFKQGRTLNASTVSEITAWTNFVMSGKIYSALTFEEQAISISTPDEIRVENLPF